MLESESVQRNSHVEAATPFETVLSASVFLDLFLPGMETLVERHSLRRMLPLLRSGGADRRCAAPNSGVFLPETASKKRKTAGKSAESAGDHSGLHRSS